MLPHFVTLYDHDFIALASQPAIDHPLPLPL